jgi:hypothetical protein
MNTSSIFKVTSCIGPSRRFYRIFAKGYKVGKPTDGYEFFITSEGNQFLTADNKRFEVIL